MLWFITDLSNQMFTMEYKQQENSILNIKMLLIV